MPTQLDNRQVVQRSALSFIGNAANEALSVLFPRIDAEMAKLFEDRNILLTDGGTITFTGTQVQLSEALNLTLNQKISGAVPQVISLGSASQTFTNNGDMMIAVIDRTAGTAVVSIVPAGSALPAVVAANQEVFLIAKRVDAGDGTQRLYWRNGSAFNAGQTARLGSAGSGGSGSGVGDDLDSLLYRASFTDLFAENATNANSSINAVTGNTNATFNAAKSMYVMLYDASKTVSTTGTAATASAAPTFTVAAGDVVISGGIVRKITAVASQTSYTLESAFPTNLVTAAACISQEVQTKDIYNLSVDGAPISSAFSGATFSDALIDYKDNATTNSNIFTPNTTPFVAFAASADGTTYTVTGQRNTLETDTENSTALPASGTSLYIRFFSNATSGSGFVNLIMYKAFMQRSTSSGLAGGITNSAYAFTNGVGTPINCTLSVVGGKTVLTLTWTYAVGAYSGTTASGVEVWINGQKIPRFVNSTLTPDGSFLESSAKTITLDRDYSAFNLSVEVFQRTQIVDNSSVNTTNISYQQEIFQNAFQAFIAQNQLMNATAIAGTPAGGSFYSSIVNRASVPDLSQDLKPRMGLERIMVQQIVPLQTEMGSSNEIIWSAVNDIFGQVRFVGDWSNSSDTNGSRPSCNQGAYVEITFYGTGLNILDSLTASAKDWRASVDGGAEGSNLYTLSSSILVSRNYSSNQIIPVVSGLSLGIHTVKVRNNAAFINNFYGFEILNQNATATNVSINPGVGYVNGKKSISSVQSAFAYTAPVTGVRGGRALVYQNADGTIGSSWTAVNAASATYTSADHTNEEITRTYFWREFGAGRADDFSTLVNSLSARSFALDDGSVHLCANNVRSGTVGTEAVGPTNGSGNFIQLTFIGTGLDVEMSNDGTTRQYDAVTIDGAASIGALSKTTATREIRKVVSGLPYGTHIVRFAMTGATSIDAPGIHKFIVYHPKKPTLPAGTVELAEYNVLATYVANTTQGLSTIGTGVIRKTPLREMDYVGTGWSVGTDFTNAIQGFYTTSGTLNDNFSYTFFGTGFEYRFEQGTLATTLQITIDGSTNLSGFANSSYGSSIASYTPATGTIVTNTTASIGNGVRVSGLALGLHTVKITKTVSGGNIFLDAFDIITPIYAAKSNLYVDLQNTLSVGSNSLSDNRKFTPVKNDSSVKAMAQAVGIANGPSTSSTVLIPMPDMSCVIKTNSTSIQVSWAVSFFPNGTSPDVVIQVYVDGVAASVQFDQALGAAGVVHTMSGTTMIPVSVGVHKVDLYWCTGNGTAVPLRNAQRLLSVKEN